MGISFITVKQIVIILHYNIHIVILQFTNYSPACAPRGGGWSRSRAGQMPESGYEPQGIAVKGCSARYDTSAQTWVICE